MKLFPLLSVLLLLALVGCASYPMGLTKEKWEALSPEQQTEYQTKQNQIDEQQRQTREARRQELLHQQAEQERQQNARLAAIYANPQLGDIIVVTIEGGEMGIGDRHRYQPVQFELARGEVKELIFRRLDQPAFFRQIQVQLNEEGNSFYFDPGMGQIQLSDDGWRSGRTYYPPEVKEVKVHSGAKNIQISIRIKRI